MKNIANRIKRLRKREGLSQDEFGEIVGISQQYVGALEAGIRWPSRALVMLMGIKFEVTEEWLRTGAGGMPKEASMMV